LSMDFKSNDKTESGLRTVQRALDILFCFSLEQQELTLTEIANKIHLAKSTTTRLLATLEQNHLIQKDPNTLKYRLGRGLYYLGYIAGKSIAVKEIAKPFMQRLRDETKETVNLYILEDESRVCIEQCEGLQSVRHLVKIGERLPLWAGAGGKVLLAYQTEEFQNLILQQVPSPARAAALRKELEDIRRAQCAASIDEREVGSAAVAAPLFDIHGEVKSCLSVSGPTHRFTPGIIDRFKEMVRSEAMEISRQLGYRGKEVNP
jgi:IclR family transcriptional regulator, KDG regulon repressor